MYCHNRQLHDSYTLTTVYHEIYISSHINFALPSWDMSPLNWRRCLWQHSIQLIHAYRKDTHMIRPLSNNKDSLCALIHRLQSLISRSGTHFLLQLQTFNAIGTHFLSQIFRHSTNISCINTACLSSSPHLLAVRHSRVLLNTKYQWHNEHSLLIAQTWCFEATTVSSSAYSLASASLGP